MSATRDRCNVRAMTTMLGERPSLGAERGALAVAAAAAGGGGPLAYDLGDGTVLVFYTTPGPNGEVGWTVIHTETTDLGGGSGSTLVVTSFTDSDGNQVVTQTETITGPTGTTTITSETSTSGTSTTTTWTQDVGGVTTTSTISMGINPLTGAPFISMTGTDGTTMTIGPDGIRLNGGEPMSPIVVTGCVDGVNRSIRILGEVLS